jgi:hypothetical protein
MNRARYALTAAVLYLCVPLASADERFVYAPFAGLAFEGTAPSTVSSSALGQREGWLLLQHGEPHAVIDGGGEAYLDFGSAETSGPFGPFPWQGALPGIAIRTSVQGPISGTLYMLANDLSGFGAHRFRIASPEEGAAARGRFHLAMEAHYARLVERNLPGAAWFRHRLGEARAQIPGRVASTAQPDGSGALWNPRPTEFDDTFELLGGARAIAENLELDRALRATGAGEDESIALEEIAGIQTRELDWKSLAKDLAPELDPLARLVPADQHGLFFPSFAAMTHVLDEADALGSPLIAFTSGRASDQQSRERYQTQLCLPLSTLSRLLGPAVIASVAVTGSDPFLPSGTDMAVLFECKQRDVLQGILAARHAAARAEPGAVAVEGEIGGARFMGVANADRSVSSYVASFGDVLVVTNSRAQLGHIAEVARGERAALAGSHEYVWFRDRYGRGEEGESALLVLTDATIRRWAGPRSRIGESRRVRAAAAMAEIQAAHVVELVHGTLEPGASAADARWPITRDFVWTKDGVASPTYGSLDFLTPIAELAFERVTPAEEAAYGRFREGYERAWRNYFDPIAVRLALADETLAADVTVMPLQLWSEYDELTALTRDAQLAPTACDPHAGALLHLALAFDPDSDTADVFSELVGPLARELGASPLSWIDHGLALYAEEDPFWDELVAAGRGGRITEENFYRLPAVLHVDVKYPLRMAGFLTALRAMADSAAPGLTRWSKRTWHEREYVRVALEEGVDLGEAASEAALYYAALPKALVVSLREDLVQKAIDRLLTPQPAGEAAPRAWLGQSMGLHVDRSALGLWQLLDGSSISGRRREAAWAALPILDEWKRLFPERDPAELHEGVWRERLAPSEDGFAWDPTTQRMASNPWGSPAAPRTGSELAPELERLRSADFGLTFEDQGLRARWRVERER